MNVNFEILTSLIADGPLTLHVTGECMRGTAPRESLIRVERRGWYAPGDIIAFGRGSGDIATHRVLGVLPGRTGWRLVTRGDHSAMADPPVPVGRVLGRVTAVSGKDYRPTRRERVRALLMWPGAAIAWAAKRYAR